MMYMIHIIYMYEYYILYIYVCICTSIYCTCKYLGHASISATKKRVIIPSLMLLVLRNSDGRRPWEDVLFLQSNIPSYGNDYPFMKHVQFINSKEMDTEIWTPGASVTLFLSKEASMCFSHTIDQCVHQLFVNRECIGCLNVHLRW